MARFRVISHSSALPSITNPIADYARQLKDGGALVLDTETTGGSHEDEVIELGIVRACDGERLLDERYRPQVRINPGAYTVHGISDAMLMGKPGIKEQWARIASLLDGKAVLAWNSSFDQRLMEQTARRYRLELPRVEWVCAMKLYKQFKSLPINTSLTNACVAMNVTPGDHSAINDALAAARVVYKMALSATADEVVEKKKEEPVSFDQFKQESDDDFVAITVAEFLTEFRWREEKTVRDEQAKTIISTWIDPVGGAVMSLQAAMAGQRARMLDGAMETGDRPWIS